MLGEICWVRYWWHGLTPVKKAARQHHNIFKLEACAGPDREDIMWYSAAVAGGHHDPAPWWMEPHWFCFVLLGVDPTALYYNNV